jgi:hypothetical protein
MFTEIVTKLSALGQRHQIIFTIIVAFCFICISWGIEKILDEHVFPHKPLHGYILIITSSLVILWLIQHLILHVV